jgi:hypothetical protein
MPFPDARRTCSEFAHVPLVEGTRQLNTGFGVCEISMAKHACNLHAFECEHLNFLTGPNNGT